MGLTMDCKYKEDEQTTRSLFPFVACDATQIQPMQSKEELFQSYGGFQEQKPTANCRKQDEINERQIKSEI